MLKETVFLVDIYRTTPIFQTINATKRLYF